MSEYIDPNSPETKRAIRIVEAQILDDKKNLLRKQIAFLRKHGKEVYDQFRAELPHLTKPAGNPTYRKMINELVESLKKTRGKLKLVLEKLQEEDV